MVICNRLHFQSKTSPTARVCTWLRLTLPNNGISSNSAKWLYMKHFHHSVHPDNPEAKHLLFGISWAAWKKFTGSLQEAEVCQRSKVFVWIVSPSGDEERLSALMGCSEGLSPSQDDVFAYTLQTQPEAGTNTNTHANSRRMLCVGYTCIRETLRGNIRAFITLLCTNHILKHLSNLKPEVKSFFFFLLCFSVNCKL